MGACCSAPNFRFKNFVVAVYPAEDDLKKNGALPARVVPNREALGKLKNYVGTNPNRIPVVCRKIHKLLQLHTQKGLVQHVGLGLLILRELIDDTATTRGAGALGGIGGGAEVDYYVQHVVAIVTTLFREAATCDHIVQLLRRASSGEEDPAPEDKVDRNSRRSSSATEGNDRRRESLRRTADYSSDEAEGRDAEANPKTNAGRASGGKTSGSSQSQVVIPPIAVQHKRMAKAAQLAVATGVTSKKYSRRTLVNDPQARSELMDELTTTALEYRTGAADVLAMLLYHLSKRGSTSDQARRLLASFLEALLNPLLKLSASGLGTRDIVALHDRFAAVVVVGNLAATLKTRLSYAIWDILPNILSNLMYAVRPSVLAALDMQQRQQLFRQMTNNSFFSGANASSLSGASMSLGGVQRQGSSQIYHGGGDDAEGEGQLSLIYSSDTAFVETIAPILPTECLKSTVLPIQPTEMDIALLRAEASGLYQLGHCCLNFFTRRYCRALVAYCHEQRAWSRFPEFVAQVFQVTTISFQSRPEMIGFVVCRYLCEETVAEVLSKGDRHSLPGVLNAIRATLGHFPLIGFRPRSVFELIRKLLARQVLYYEVEAFALSSSGTGQGQGGPTVKGAMNVAGLPGRRRGSGQAPFEALMLLLRALVYEIQASKDEGSPDDANAERGAVGRQPAGVGSQAELMMSQSSQASVGIGASTNEKLNASAKHIPSPNTGAQEAATLKAALAKPGHAMLHIIDSLIDRTERLTVAIGSIVASPLSTLGGAGSVPGGEGGAAAVSNSNNAAAAPRTMLCGYLESLAIVAPHIRRLAALQSLQKESDQPSTGEVLTSPGSVISPSSAIGDASSLPAPSPEETFDTSARYSQRLLQMLSPILLSYGRWATFEASQSSSPASPTPVPIGNANLHTDPQLWEAAAKVLTEFLRPNVNEELYANTMDRSKNSNHLGTSTTHLSNTPNSINLNHNTSGRRDSTVGGPMLNLKHAVSVDAGLDDGGIRGPPRTHHRSNFDHPPPTLGGQAGIDGTAIYQSTASYSYFPPVKGSEGGAPTPPKAGQHQARSHTRRYLMAPNDHLLLLELMSALLKLNAGQLARKGGARPVPPQQVELVEPLLVVLAGSEEAFKALNIMSNFHTPKSLCAVGSIYTAYMELVREEAAPFIIPFIFHIQDMAAENTQSLMVARPNTSSTAVAPTRGHIRHSSDLNASSGGGMGLRINSSGTWHGANDSVSSLASLPVLSGSTSALCNCLHNIIVSIIHHYSLVVNCPALSQYAYSILQKRENSSPCEYGRWFKTRIAENLMPRQCGLETVPEMEDETLSMAIGNDITILMREEVVLRHLLAIEQLNTSSGELLRMRKDGDEAQRMLSHFLSINYSVLSKGPQPLAHFQAFPPATGGAISRRALQLALAQRLADHPTLMAAKLMLGQTQINLASPPTHQSGGTRQYRPQGSSGNLFKGHTRVVSESVASQAPSIPRSATPIYLSKDALSANSTVTMGGSTMPPKQFTSPAQKKGLMATVTGLFSRHTDPNNTLVGSIANGQSPSPIRLSPKALSQSAFTPQRPLGHGMGAITNSADFFGSEANSTASLCDPFTQGGTSALMVLNGRQWWRHTNPYCNMRDVLGQIMLILSDRNEARARVREVVEAQRLVALEKAKRAALAESARRGKAKGEVAMSSSLGSALSDSKSSTSSSPSESSSSDDDDFEDDYFLLKGGMGKRMHNRRRTGGRRTVGQLLVELGSATVESAARLPGMQTKATFRRVRMVSGALSTRKRRMLMRKPPTLSSSKHHGDGSSIFDTEGADEDDGWDDGTRASPGGRQGGPLGTNDYDYHQPTSGAYKEYYGALFARGPDPLAIDPLHMAPHQQARSYAAVATPLVTSKRVLVGRVAPPPIRIGSAASFGSAAFSAPGLTLKDYASHKISDSFLLRGYAASALSGQVPAVFSNPQVLSNGSNSGSNTPQDSVVNRSLGVGASAEGSLRGAASAATSRQVTGGPLSATLPPLLQPNFNNSHNGSIISFGTNASPSSPRLNLSVTIRALDSTARSIRTRGRQAGDSNRTVDRSANSAVSGGADSFFLLSAPRQGQSTLQHFANINSVNSRGQVVSSDSEGVAQYRQRLQSVGTTRIPLHAIGMI